MNDKVRFCGECRFYSDEGMDGAGYCSVLDSAWCYCDSLACGHYEEAYEAGEHAGSQTDEMDFSGVNNQLVYTDAAEKRQAMSNDNVNHPAHYTQGGIECIDAMLSAFGDEAVQGVSMATQAQRQDSRRLEQGAMVSRQVAGDRAERGW